MSAFIQRPCIYRRRIDKTCDTFVSRYFHIHITRKTNAEQLTQIGEERYTMIVTKTTGNYWPCSKTRGRTGAPPRNNRRNHRRTDDRRKTKKFVYLTIKKKDARVNTHVELKRLISSMIWLHNQYTPGTRSWRSCDHLRRSSARFQRTL